MHRESPKKPLEERKERQSRQNKKPGAIRHKRSVLSQDASTATVTDRPKSSRDAKLILKALSRHFIFSCLTDENKAALIAAMKCYSLGAHEFVFQQDEPGTHFFIVASGKLEQLVNAKRVKLLGPEDNFGELALVHDTTRTDSVKTVEKSTLWGLDRRAFKQAISHINKQNYSENRNFVENVPIFSVLNKGQKAALLDSFSTFAFRPQDVIVAEGDAGDCFYLIKEGVVMCSKERVEIRELGRGDYFGEQALLYNSPRTATVIALTETKCLVINSETLNHVLADKFAQIIHKNSIRIALDKSEHLSLLTEHQKEKLIGNFTIKIHTTDQVVAAQDSQKNERLLIVLRGLLTVGNTLFPAFECIGDEEVLSTAATVFTENLVASEESEVAEMPLTVFRECTAVESGTTESLAALQVLKKIQLFRGLPESKLTTIQHSLTLTHYTAGQEIVLQGTRGDCFYIIKSGNVDIVKGSTVIRSITYLDYFGERSLLYNEPRTASVFAREDVTCWQLSQESFHEVFDEHIRGLLQERIELQDDTISLADLAVVKLLGKGSFGNVYLVVHKEKQTLFALKCVNKAKIEHYEMQKSIVLERQILLKLDHVLIAKLVKTFKDAARLYFLQEVIIGEELFEVLRILDVVSEDESRFYAGCIVLILEHLHERDIAYRDLKPENIMIDQRGYPRLIDFGISKILKGRTSTVVGTPHYMAPEMITAKGYSVEVDWYALGVMLFEFIFGDVPFGAAEEDPYAIYQQTMNHSLSFPQHVQHSQELRRIVEQLLDMNPANRTRGGVASLQKNRWFRGLEWDRLLTKELPTPYRPPAMNIAGEVKRAILIKDRLVEVVARDEDFSQSKRGSKTRLKGWDDEF